MGLILDTSVLIAAERKSLELWQMLAALDTTPGEAIGLSTISVSEFAHGIYRSRTPVERRRREAFAERCYEALTLYPVDYDVAVLGGKIEAELAMQGIVAGFADVLIGATALHRGYRVATYNKRHFEMIPGLEVVAPSVTL